MIKKRGINVFLSAIEKKMICLLLSDIFNDFKRVPLDLVTIHVLFAGYLTEKSLFYYNPLMPHLQRRLNDDMSHYPTPYKLMRSMLMSPGSLSGYTFYRIRPESAETISK